MVLCLSVYLEGKVHGAVLVYLEGEVVRSTCRGRVDLHGSCLHGVRDEDGLVDVLGEYTALHSECHQVHGCRQQGDAEEAGKCTETSYKVWFIQVEVYHQ